MARQARKQMADMRALEQMAERSNIVDPREVTTHELLDKGYNEYENELVMENLPGRNRNPSYPSHLPGRSLDGSGMLDGIFEEKFPLPKPTKGKGATPTMGLSMVRGGAKHKEAHAMGAKLRAYLESLHGGEYAEAFAGGCGAGMSGGAKRKGNKRSGASCAMTEEECADKGGSYFDGECYGVTCDGPEPEPEPEPEPGKTECPSIYKNWVSTNIYSVGARVTYEGKVWEAVVMSPRHAPGTDVGWNEVDCSPKKGGRRGAGRMVGGLANRSGNVQQSGSFEGLGRRVAGGNMSGDADVTGGHCPSRAHLREDVTGKGGKKRRAPASAGDGRRARAEIVKKVMREKGLKMIEASKYVKAHNLY